MPDIEDQLILDSKSIFDIEEKDVVLPRSSSPVYEHSVSTRRKLIALLGYFICNVGLTMYNKAVLGRFAYPWILTSIHAASSSIGCAIMLRFGYFHMSKLTRHENMTLLAFSMLFTINIAVSNVSLSMVSIPFHQVVRGTTPLFTTAIYRLAYNRSFSTATYLSLLPIVLGVSLATYGDLTYTRAGAIMTFVGVLLAAVKTIVTNRILTGRLALSPIEVLYRMSPLACLQSLVIAALQGEFTEVTHTMLNLVSDSKMPQTASISSQSKTTHTSLLTLILILLGNGALAFALNISSFTTNKLAGALTMTVCANIKQCMTIMLGILLFNTTATAINLWGIAITLAGGAIYSFVELRGKK